MPATIHPLHPKELPGLPISYSFAESPFGRLLVASTSKGLCAVQLVPVSDAESIDKLQKAFPKAHLRAAIEPLHEDFRTQFSDEPAPLHYHLLGTPFQLAVWTALLTIPKGGTSTYGRLAAQIEKPKACRAVGSAVGDNPIFYAIPCHRVLPASGGVGNYYWGSEIKARILRWEKAIW